MNTNELIKFNWDEYQKGGWEAVVYDRVVTEVSSPDNQGAHFFKTPAGIWNLDIGNIRMRRKLRDAWVVVHKDKDGELHFYVDFSESEAKEEMRCLELEGNPCEIHHIKTAL